MYVVFCVKGFGNQQEIIQVLCVEICLQTAQMQPV